MTSLNGLRENLMDLLEEDLAPHYGELDQLLQKRKISVEGVSTYSQPDRKEEQTETVDAFPTFPPPISDGTRLAARRLANDLADHLEANFMIDNAREKSHDDLVKVYNSLMDHIGRNPAVLDAAGRKCIPSRKRQIVGRQCSALSAEEEMIFYPPRICGLRPRGDWEGRKHEAEQTYGPQYTFFKDDTSSREYRDTYLTPHILAELRDVYPSRSLLPMMTLMTNAHVGSAIRKALYLYIIERLKCYYAISCDEVGLDSNVPLEISSVFAGTYRDHMMKQCSPSRDGCLHIIERRLYVEVDELIRHLHRLRLLGTITSGLGIEQRGIFNHIKRHAIITLVPFPVVGKPLGYQEANIVLPSDLTVAPKRGIWGVAYEAKVTVQYNIPPAVVPYKNSYRLLPRAIYSVVVNGQDDFVPIEDLFHWQGDNYFQIEKVFARTTIRSEFGDIIKDNDNIVHLPVNPHVSAGKGGGGTCCLGGYQIELQNCVESGDWDSIGFLLDKFHGSYDVDDTWGKLISNFPRLYELKRGDIVEYVYHPEDSYGRLISLYPWHKESFYVTCGPSRHHVYYKGKRALSHEEWVQCHFTGKIIRRDSAIRLPIYASESALRELAQTGPYKALSITSNIADLLRLEKLKETLWGKFWKRKMPELHERALRDEARIDGQLAQYKQVRLTGYDNGSSITSATIHGQHMTSEGIRSHRRNYYDRVLARQLVDDHARELYEQEED